MTQQVVWVWHNLGVNHVADGTKEAGGGCMRVGLGRTLWVLGALKGVVSRGVTRSDWWFQAAFGALDQFSHLRPARRSGELFFFSPRGGSAPCDAVNDTCRDLNSRCFALNLITLSLLILSLHQGAGIRKLYPSLCTFLSSLPASSHSGVRWTHSYWMQLYARLCARLGGSCDEDAVSLALCREVEALTDSWLR